MKDVLVLTKVLLKNAFQKNKSSKFKNGALKYFAYICIYIYIAGIIGYISYEMIKNLLEINQEGVFINIILLGMAGFIIFQTIFTSLNVLFFSKDIEFLLPLPIKPTKIIMAKFNVLLISEYIMELIIGLVPLSVYGYLTGAGFMYYVLSLFILIIFPIVPVLLSSLFIIVIMRFTNIIKNKDIVQYLTVFITIVLVVVIQMLSSSGQEITNVELAEKLVETNGLVSIYSKYFITLEPTMNAILNYNNIEGFKNLAILLVETIVFYIVVVGIGSRLYIKTASKGFSGGGRKGKTINDSKQYESNTNLSSYVKKEFKILIRNPIFFMQCILPSFLFPIILSIPLFSMGNSEEIKSLVMGLNSPIGFAICISIVEFFFMFNYISITAISRDGANAIFMKYIPIPLYKQCIYKVLPSIILNLIPLTYLVAALKIILPSIDFMILFYIFIVSLLLNILESYMMIIVDLKRPKLTWTSEYAVVKQNFNMIFEAFFGLVVILITILYSNILKNINLLTIGMIILLAVGIYATDRYVYTNQHKLFKKII